MIKPIIFIALQFSVLTMSSNSYSQDEFSALEGLYLGQITRHENNI